MHRSSATLRIGVSDLLAESGRRRSVAVEAAVTWALELSRVLAEPPLRAELVLDGTSGGVYATGSVAVRIGHTCHRCLSDWEEDLELAFAEMLGGEDPEYPLEDDVVDLEEPLRDTVVLALPLLPTCRPGCLGLCAACGADLNTDACPGHDEEPDTPFAVLRELLEP